MASTTTRRRRWMQGLMWLLGGYIIFKLLFSHGDESIPSRLSQSASSSNLGLEASDSPVAIESGGQWLMAMVQTVLGWIGSLITVALVFAVIAIAVMLLTDWAGKRT